MTDMIIATSAPTPTHIQVGIANVPFYSQFTDIESAKWQKVGCGVTSLAMIIDYYKPDAVSVETLLTRGIASGAYDQSAGWSHQGLISLSKKYGLDGSSYDLSGSGMTSAFGKLTAQVKKGPVIVSVHYKFDPKSTIPHLVVVDGISGDTVYYNDPASKSGQKHISVSSFQAGWKKKYIVVRPTAVAVVSPTTDARSETRQPSLTLFLDGLLGRFTA